VAGVVAAEDVAAAAPDVMLKHDIALGYLDNGLGFYRFKYYGNDKASWA
jgi:hypothetical protein